jgi:hypothetical protein
VSVLTVLINPNGIQTWLIPFKTVGVKVLQTLIDEWASPDFHVLALQPFLILISVLWLVIALSPRKVRGLTCSGNYLDRYEFDGQTQFWAIGFICFAGWRALRLANRTKSKKAPG